LSAGMAKRPPFDSHADGRVVLLAAPRTAAPRALPRALTCALTCALPRAPAFALTRALTRALTCALPRAPARAPARAPLSFSRRARAKRRALRPGPLAFCAPCGRAALRAPRAAEVLLVVVRFRVVALILIIVFSSHRGKPVVAALLRRPISALVVLIGLVRISGIVGRHGSFVVAGCFPSFGVRIFSGRGRGRAVAGAKKKSYGLGGKRTHPKTLRKKSRNAELRVQRYRLRRGQAQAQELAQARRRRALCEIDY